MRLTNWIDVVEIIPQYFDFFNGEFKYDLNANKVNRTIENEQSEIISALRAFYPNLTASTLSIMTYSLTQNKNPEFTGDYSKILKINPITALYTITFEDTETFKIKKDTEAEVSGSTDTDLTLTDITIKKEFWNPDSFFKGDKIYLSVKCVDPIISLLASKLVAGFILENTYMEQTSGNSTDAVTLKSYVNKKLNELVDLKNANRLSIPRIEPLAGDIEISYVEKINDFGSFID